MRAYSCEIILHDYLFFATTERGKVAETGGFIHNYALTYALGLATSAWRNEIQRPRYEEELGPAFEERRAYATPAQPIDVLYVTTQYNTMPETFTLAKRQSIGYPEWGFIRCARPDSRYRFYVLARAPLRLPRFIRLGKFMAKARLEAVEAADVQRLDAAVATSALLNLEDLLVRPVSFDLLANALPSRLVRNAAFPQIPHVRARFRDDSVLLPLPMAYPGGQSCESL